MLRPLPHRGDVVAAGAVALAALVALLQLRFDEVWADGVHVAYAAMAVAFVGALGLRAPREGPEPRPYQSALLVTTLALAAVTLGRLAALVGAGGFDSGGTIAWLAGALAALGLGLGYARSSAVCILLGAVSMVTALVGVVQWLFSPDGVGPFRWLLLVLAGAFAFATVAERDRRPSRAVAMADVAGLTALALALSFGFSLGEDGADAETAGAGWELFLYACGFGLCAYSAVDRAPGPGWIGGAVLVITTLVASVGDATLLGWPVVLGAGAAALLVVGLRPSRPLPPPPGGGEALVFDIREER
jgi:hypothetical protein